ncbi:tetratricopeptide repeat-containing sensor histidine kinase [Flagellimonas zhangzhouensis]|uniref:Histidine kinase-, DNA gyrase B-, and HSP90-like ATPase n=1 Tax=Flagellimonas zhangzhouensis TaxID=1073328 RepID=A0A1H2U5V8_9FLAO|nr:tetratricopeptide repeat-containing sensor histidine kinase [Allomuricauda zhangzhouensis]SDQ19917.1 Tetratricopeptide repeat-containing protein [Allomuricauda zhangzhouensis]SDW51603.1 Histidine kinase-, DNA gyrase B-, and HSP90-like ATPase [Allomuricauda zhangzhouensis]
MTIFQKTLIPILLFGLLSLHTVEAQDIQQAINALKDTLEVKEGEDRILVLKDIAMKFRSIDMDSARYYTKLAFNEAEALDDDYYRARIWIVYGILSWDEGRPKEALSFHLKAKPILENSKDYFVLGSLYTNLANTYEALSEFDKAVDFQFKALESFTEGKDTLWIAGSYLNLGNRYKLIQEPGLTMEYYLKALDLYERIGNNYFMAMCYNSLAVAYLENKQYNKAIEYAKKSYDTNKDVGAVLELAYPLTNLALASWALGKYDEAELYYIEAIALQEKKGERLALISLKNDLANIYLNQGKMNRAEKLALTTYREADSIDYLPGIDALSKTLSLIYEEKPDFKKAYVYHQKHKAARDSLYFTEKAKEMFNLKEKYESEQKENEILRQKNELVEGELALKNRNNMLMGSGALLAILLIVGFVIFREQKVKAKNFARETALEKAMAEARAQENLKEQRLRIARDLHDNIGSQLTYLTSITDSAKRGIDKGEVFLMEKLTQMKQFSLVTISELRDTIWAMNKDEISLEDIKERTQQLAATVHEATDDKVRMKVEGRPDHKVLNAFVGMNLFRIIQESVNNAVKHSGSEQIQVRFTDIDEKVQIEIEDFGQGFDTLQSSNGNGLQIMKNRAEKAGIDFKQESIIGKSTKVTLQVKA